MATNMSIPQVSSKIDIGLSLRELSPPPMELDLSLGFGQHIVSTNKSESRFQETKHNGSRESINKSVGLRHSHKDFNVPRQVGDSDAFFLIKLDKVDFF